MGNCVSKFVVFFVLRFEAGEGWSLHKGNPSCTLRHWRQSRVTETARMRQKKLCETELEIGQRNVSIPRNCVNGYQLSSWRVL